MFLIGGTNNVTVIGRESKTDDSGFSFLLILFCSFDTPMPLDKIGIHLATIMH